MSKCNVQQLVDNAGCFFCLSPGEIQAAKLSLLCKIAQKLNSSISCSPNSLLANATEFVTLDNGMRDVVKAQLLCEIWKGGGSGIILTLPTDPDAAAFVCGWLNICAAQTGECTSTNNCAPGTPVPISALCASFCGITQTEVNALETLVTQLKAAGLWDLMDVIYPFMGANAGACSLNLKDTTKFAITWHGGVTFSAAGVTGDGATGYGDTGYNPSVSGVNFQALSAGIGVYVPTAATSAFTFGYTDGSVFSNNSFLVGNAGKMSVWGINGGNTSGIVGTGAVVNGNFAATITGVNTREIYTPTQNSPDLNVHLSDGLVNGSFAVLGSNSTYPAFTTGPIAFAWAGTGFSGVQIASLFTIITTFETSLGRA